MVSTESGSFTSARTIVQLYLDNKDLGQVCFVCDVVVVVDHVVVVVQLYLDNKDLGQVGFVCDHPVAGDVGDFACSGDQAFCCLPCW